MTKLPTDCEMWTIPTDFDCGDATNATPAIPASFHTFNRGDTVGPWPQL